MSGPSCFPCGGAQSLGAGANGPPHRFLGDSITDAGVARILGPSGAGSPAVERFLVRPETARPVHTPGISVDALSTCVALGSRCAEPRSRTCFSVRFCINDNLAALRHDEPDTSEPSRRVRSLLAEAHDRLAASNDPGRAFVSGDAEQANGGMPT